MFTKKCKKKTVKYVIVLKKVVSLQNLFLRREMFVVTFLIIITNKNNKQKIISDIHNEKNI